MIHAFGSDALYGPATVIANFLNDHPGYPEAFLYITIASLPVVLLHELGHALAARRLLDTPVSIALGSTGRLAQLRLGEISLTLNAIGSAGIATFDASRASARDMLLIALAGPITSAAGVLVSVAALANVPAHGAIHGIVWATVLGGFMAVLNVIPFKYQDRRNTPIHHSDGRIALDAARTLRALR